MFKTVVVGLLLSLWVIFDSLLRIWSQYVVATFYDGIEIYVTSGITVRIPYNPIRLFRANGIAINYVKRRDFMYLLSYHEAHVPAKAKGRSWLIYYIRKYVISRININISLQVVLFDKFSLHLSRMNIQKKSMEAMRLYFNSELLTEVKNVKFAQNIFSIESIIPSNDVSLWTGALVHIRNTTERDIEIARSSTSVKSKLRRFVKSIEALRNYRDAGCPSLLAHAEAKEIQDCVSNAYGRSDTFNDVVLYINRLLRHKKVSYLDEEAVYELVESELSNYYDLVIPGSTELFTTPINDYVNNFEIKINYIPCFRDPIGIIITTGTDTIGIEHTPINITLSLELIAALQRLSVSYKTYSNQTCQSDISGIIVRTRLRRKECNYDHTRKIVLNWSGDITSTLEDLITTNIVFRRAEISQRVLDGELKFVLTAGLSLLVTDMQRQQVIASMSPEISYKSGYLPEFQVSLSEMLLCINLELIESITILMSTYQTPIPELLLDRKRYEHHADLIDTFITIDNIQIRVLNMKVPNEILSVCSVGIPSVIDLDLYLTSTTIVGNRVYIDDLMIVSSTTTIAKALSLVVTVGGEHASVQISDLETRMTPEIYAAAIGSISPVRSDTQLINSFSPGTINIDRVNSFLLMLRNIDFTGLSQVEDYRELNPPRLTLCVTVLDSLKVGMAGISYQVNMEFLALQLELYGQATRTSVQIKNLQAIDRHVQILQTGSIEFRLLSTKDNITLDGIEYKWGNHVEGEITEVKIHFTVFDMIQLWNVLSGFVLTSFTASPYCVVYSDITRMELLTIAYRSLLQMLSHSTILLVQNPNSFNRIKHRLPLFYRSLLILCDPGISIPFLLRSDSVQLYIGELIRYIQYPSNGEFFARIVQGSHLLNKSRIRLVCTHIEASLVGREFVAKIDSLDISTYDHTRKAEASILQSVYTDYIAKFIKLDYSVTPGTTLMLNERRNSPWWLVCGHAYVLESYSFFIHDATLVNLVDHETITSSPFSMDVTFFNPCGETRSVLIWPTCMYVKLYLASTRMTMSRSTILLLLRFIVLNRSKFIEGSNEVLASQYSSSCDTNTGIQKIIMLELKGLSARLSDLVEVKLESLRLSIRNYADDETTVMHMYSKNFSVSLTHAKHILSSVTASKSYCTAVLTTTSTMKHTPAWSTEIFKFEVSAEYTRPVAVLTSKGMHVSFFHLEEYSSVLNALRELQALFVSNVHDSGEAFSNAVRRSISIDCIRPYYSLEVNDSSIIIDTIWYQIPQIKAAHGHFLDKHANLIHCTVAAIRNDHLYISEISIKYQNRELELGKLHIKVRLPRLHSYISTYRSIQETITSLDFSSFTNTAIEAQPSVGHSIGQSGLHNVMGSLDLRFYDGIICEELTSDNPLVYCKLDIQAIDFTALIIKEFCIDVSTPMLDTEALLRIKAICLVAGIMPASIQLSREMKEMFSNHSSDYRLCISDIDLYATDNLVSLAVKLQRIFQSTPAPIGTRFIIHPSSRLTSQYHIFETVRLSYNESLFAYHQHLCTIENHLDRQIRVEVEEICLNEQGKSILRLSHDITLQPLGFSNIVSKSLIQTNLSFNLKFPDLSNEKINIHKLKLQSSAIINDSFMVTADSADLLRVILHYPYMSSIDPLFDPYCSPPIALSDGSAKEISISDHLDDTSQMDDDKLEDHEEHNTPGLSHTHETTLASNLCETAISRTIVLNNTHRHIIVESNLEISPYSYLIMTTRMAIQLARVLPPVFECIQLHSRFDADYNFYLIKLCSKFALYDRNPEIALHRFNELPRFLNLSITLSNLNMHISCFQEMKDILSFQVASAHLTSQLNPTTNYLEMMFSAQDSKIHIIWSNLKQTQETLIRLKESSSIELILKSYITDLHHLILNVSKLSLVLPRIYTYTDLRIINALLKAYEAICTHLTRFKSSKEDIDAVRATEFTPLIEDIIATIDGDIATSVPYNPRRELLFYMEHTEIQTSFDGLIVCFSSEIETRYPFISHAFQTYVARLAIQLAKMIGSINDLLINPFKSQHEHISAKILTATELIEYFQHTTLQVPIREILSSYRFNVKTIYQYIRNLLDGGQIIPPTVRYDKLMLCGSVLQIERRDIPYRSGLAQLFKGHKMKISDRMVLRNQLLSIPNAHKYPVVYLYTVTTNVLCVITEYYLSLDSNTIIYLRDISSISYFSGAKEIIISLKMKNSSVRRMRTNNIHIMKQIKLAWINHRIYHRS